MIVEEKQRDGALAYRNHPRGSSSTGACPHQVQFYDDEEYLHDLLFRYFAPFLGASEESLGGLVLARALTIKYLEECLLLRYYTKTVPTHTRQNQSGDR